jgi:high-affinity Fe2+/Pb2+ permease
MNVTPDSLIAFAVVVIALALGWLVYEYMVAPLVDDEDELL